MKKIMMIAAVAATMIGTAFGACEYTPDTPAVKSGCWAYNWKFSGKTTKGAVVKGVAPKSTGACGYVGGGREGGFVRVPASLKIQGYTWYCEPGCGSDDFEAALVEANEIFWVTKPFRGSLAGGVTIEVSNIIGKKAKDYEVMGTASFIGAVDSNDPTCGQDITTYTFTFAGLGKYDKSNSRVKSASGNFAGTASYPWYISKTVCAEATVWDCATLTLIDDSVNSVVFGKWSVKFNKTAARKITNGKNVAKAINVPRWVVYANAE